MKFGQRVKVGGLAALFLFLYGSAAMAYPIQVKINGKMVEFYEQQPVLRNGRVLVPMRRIFNVMHIKSWWNPVNRTVTATHHKRIVELPLGSRRIRVNGHSEPIDVPAQMIGGQVMVPLSFVSELLNREVHWNDSTETVSIRS